MPELPEVETMVRGLRSRIKNKRIIDVWTDERKLFYHPSFSVLKKKIKDSSIMDVRRRGKIIVFHLKPQGFLLFHPKMTGHFLILSPKTYQKEYIEDKSIHAFFELNNNQYLAWSDQRKFSRIEYWPTETIEDIKWLANLGDEPLVADFTFERFNELIDQNSARIKSWLMDQKHIVGIGNIYANEILWATKINPYRQAKSLSLSERKKIFSGIKKILKQAIIEGGTSIAEFRNVNDQEGKYSSYLKIYRKNGKCPRCHQSLKREIIGNRSTYYCPYCQK